MKVYFAGLPAGWYGFSGYPMVVEYLEKFVLARGGDEYNRLVSYFFKDSVEGILVVKRNEDLHSCPG